MTRSVSDADLRIAIRHLSLSERPVCIHASLRSFGAPIEGGAGGVLRAFLDEGCTVLTPAFSWGFAVPPPPSEPRPARNGWDYERFSGPTAGIGRIYSPSTNEIDADMGALAATVVQSEGRRRGAHPLNSFAAVGPLAGRLIASQSPTDVYAPLRALAEADGHILLIGVGLDKMTLLHCAEEQAGRVLFRRWANNAEGRSEAIAVGGCSEGFGNLTNVLAPLTQTTRVAQSVWQAYLAARILECAARAIGNMPSITHCGNVHCERCRDAIAGGALL